MNNMDIAGVLGQGLLYILGGALIILLVAAIIFRTATKWVTQQDVSIGMSIAIVILGGIASIAGSFPTSLLLELVGLLSGLANTIISFIVSFCATSCVYFLMLKISFWKASLIADLKMHYLYIQKPSHHSSLFYSQGSQ